MSRRAMTAVLVGLALVAALALAHAPAPAAAAVRGPDGTVKAYISALQDRDARRACALQDLRDPRTRTLCRKVLRTSLSTFTVEKARPESSAFVRGGRARVVVDVVLVAKTRVWASRARVLLRRSRGRWWIRTTGTLPGAIQSYATAAEDPAPAGDDAALRRLADDELLALGNNQRMLCTLLAPGAPLGVDDGGCATLSVNGKVVAARAARVAIRRGGADHARLDITATARRALRAGSRGGWTMRAQRWTDTLFAIRSGGRWLLVKPSRSAYRIAGVAPPTDVDEPTATAVWPAPAPTPSLSERPVPERCHRPAAIRADDCEDVRSLVAGAGLVAWTTGFSQTWARPVAGGIASGPVAPASVSASTQRSAWIAIRLVPVLGGALLLERNVVTSAVRAVPLGPDGRPRAPTQTVASELDRDYAGTDGLPLPLIAGPPGASTAVFLAPGRKLIALDADGRRAAAPKGSVDPEHWAVVVRPDGGLVSFGKGYDELHTESRLTVGLTDVDGRDAGAELSVAPLDHDADVVGFSITGSVGVDGRVLVTWSEQHGDGHGAVRAWALDPAAPTATQPVTVAALPKAVSSSGPGVDGSIALEPLADGGWDVASGHLEALEPDRVAVWAARLRPTGALVAPARRVAPGIGVETGFGLTGGAVVWADPPPASGLAQVRSAPLP